VLLLLLFPLLSAAAAAAVPAAECCCCCCCCCSCSCCGGLLPFGGRSSAAYHLIVQVSSTQLETCQQQHYPAACPHTQAAARRCPLGQALPRPHSRLPCQLRNAICVLLQSALSMHQSTVITSTCCHSAWRVQAEPYKYKYLGVMLSADCTWKAHVEYTVAKATRARQQRYGQCAAQPPVGC
jgi:hypothetical protein